MMFGGVSLDPVFTMVKANRRVSRNAAQSIAEPLPLCSESETFRQLSVVQNYMSKSSNTLLIKHFWLSNTSSKLSRENISHTNQQHLHLLI